MGREKELRKRVKGGEGKGSAFPGSGPALAELSAVGGPSGRADLVQPRDLRDSASLSVALVCARRNGEEPCRRAPGGFAGPQPHRPALQSGDLLGDPVRMNSTITAVTSRFLRPP
jgi:hypothetical protein